MYSWKGTRPTRGVPCSVYVSVRYALMFCLRWNDTYTYVGKICTYIYKCIPVTQFIDVMHLLCDSAIQAYQY